MTVVNVTENTTKVTVKGDRIIVAYIERGAAGQGVPQGGTTGQVLKKTSNADYATTWADETGGGGGGAVTSVNTRTGAVVLNKSDVGLSNADNTSDVNKPVSTAQQAALDGKQPLDADLTAIAGLDSTQSGVVASDGSGWFRKTYAALKTAIGLSNVTNDAQLKAADLDTDGTLAANSDTKIASQKATKTYADTKIPKSLVTAKGDIVAATGSGAPVNVAVGTDGQVLAADSTQTPGVKWVTPSAGGGAALAPTAVKTANYTASVNDLVLADTNTSGAFTVTLPSAPADKSIVAVKHVLQGHTSNYPNAVTVARGGTDTFDKASGPTSVLLPQLNSLAVFQYQASTGVWHQTTDHRDLSALDARLLSSTVIIPQSAWQGTGADMMTPLVSGNNATTLAVSPGSIILALAIHSGQTVNVLEVVVSATSLTAGQGITVGCYEYNANGTIGRLLWSQVLTIGTSTGAIKVTGLSKVMPTGRCVIAVLNPSSNAGSVTLRAQSAQTGRGFPIDFQNGGFSHSLLATGRATLDADFSSVLFRSAVATNELTAGPVTFPIIGAWT